jgi:hypothetical protein
MKGSPFIGALGIHACECLRVDPDCKWSEAEFLEIAIKKADSRFEAEASQDYFSDLKQSAWEKWEKH